MTSRVLILFALIAWTRLEGEPLKELADNLIAPFTEPDDQSFGFTMSFGDSDEDAVYSIHRGWYRDIEETAFEYGWEVGGGAAHSGKRDETGAFLYLDLVAGAEIFELWELEVDLRGFAGVQLQTIEVPGRTYHNFRLGVFLDWELEVGDDEWFIRTGYLHLSNANIGGGNEGHDGLWAGVGITW